LVKDHRLPPFSYVTHGDFVRLQAEFPTEKQRTQAMAIYLSFAYTASRARARGLDGDFEATRSEVAARAGVSLKTLDRLVPRFEKARLLAVERRREGLKHLPNRWTLLGGDSQTLPSEGGDSQTLGVPQTLGGCDSETPGVATGGRTTDKEGTEEVNPLASLGDPGEDGEVILDEEADRFCRYLAAAASEAAGSTRRVERHWLVPARELLDRVPKAELRAVVDWAHTRSYWVTKVRTMPMLKDAWPRVRAEWATAQRQGSAKSSARQERTRRRLAYSEEE
jgi:hypothetical protein